MKRFSVPTIVPSICSACSLALAGLWIVLHGPQSAPTPLRELCMRATGLAEEPAAKAIVAILFAFALLSVLLRDKRIALALGGLLAFVSLMSISRAVRDGAIEGSMVFAFALGVGCVILALQAREPEVKADRAIGLSASWRVLAIVLALASAGFTAARIDFQRKDNTVPPAQVIDMQLESSVGKALSATAIATYLPTVEAMIAAGGNTGWIVFFNPHCSACHAFFDEHFQGPQAEPIIAVEIPLAEGEVAAAGDDLGAISCASCEFVGLPAGPLWLVAPPAALRIEGGIVTCFSDKISGDCFSVK